MVITLAINLRSGAYEDVHSQIDALAAEWTIGAWYRLRFLTVEGEATIERIRFGSYTLGGYIEDVYEPDHVEMYFIGQPEPPTCEMSLSLADILDHEEVP